MGPGGCKASDCNVSTDEVKAAGTNSNRLVDAQQANWFAKAANIYVLELAVFSSFSQDAIFC